MMMAGLAMLANTAMAANETEVLPGNQYAYSLTNIELTEAATAVVEFEGTNSGAVTIYESDGVTTFPASLAMVASATSLGFEILYAEGADDTATNDSIKVTITYGGTNSSCSNIIKYGIDILPPPTYTLAIAVDIAQTCQERTGTGQNLADARGTESNTITFTVTPTIDNIPNNADFTFTYDITLTDLTGHPIADIVIAPAVGTISNTQTSDGNTYNTGDDYLLTFTTTTGVDTEVITAALDDIATNATLSVDDGGSGGSYTATSGGAQSVTTTISAVPTMGSF
jgi:hypothetical protein